MPADPSHHAQVGGAPTIAGKPTVAPLPSIAEAAIPRAPGRRIEDPCGCVSVEVARDG
jgi:hypothetical protein